MSHPGGESGRAPRARGGELVIPGLALIFTLYYFYSIQDAPWTAKVSTYFVGSVLIGLVVIFCIVCLREVRRGQASLRFQGLDAPRRMLPKRAALLALTAGYIFALEWGGFTLTSAVFLYSAILLLGGTRVWRNALITAIAVPLMGYLVFVVAFQTRFPEGPFERLLDGLF